MFKSSTTEIFQENPYTFKITLNRLCCDSVSKTEITTVDNDFTTTVIINSISFVLWDAEQVGKPLLK